MWPTLEFEQIAVVADHDQRMRVAREMLLQPERAFEVEVIGRLVEQQQVGLGEQGGGERNAHAPAAGEFRARPLLIVRRKTEPGQDRGGAGRGRVRANVGKPGLDLGNAVRVLRRLGFRQQVGAFRIGAQHHLDQPVRAVRSFLRQPPDAPARRHGDAAVLRCHIAGDHREQRGLAGAVAPDQADARPGRNIDRSALDQRAAGDADGKVVDDQHGARFGRERCVVQSHSVIPGRREAAGPESSTTRQVLSSLPVDSGLALMAASRNDAPKITANPHRSRADRRSGRRTGWPRCRLRATAARAPGRGDGPGG